MLKSAFLIIYVFIASIAFNGDLEARVKPVISECQNAHIIERHWHDANPKLKTSIFNESIEKQNLFTITSVTLNNGKHQVQNNGMHCHEYTFRRPIGKSFTGQASYTLRVITDPNRSNGEDSYVVTAFPVK